MPSRINRPAAELTRFVRSFRVLIVPPISMSAPIIVAAASVMPVSVVLIDPPVPRVNVPVLSAPRSAFARNVPPAVMALPAALMMMPF